MINKFLWVLFVLFAISIGLYPVIYALVDMSQGLLASKPAELVASTLYKSAFNLHIALGGLSLLTGWSQFSRKFRAKNISTHRTLGKTYLISVMISGICGLYIAFFATGGWISALGFGGLAMAWLFTSSSAYRAIRSKDIDSHERWMIRSYALTFAAVTLRIWLPLSMIAGLEFVFAYRIISFLCWVPNLLIAEILISKKDSKVVARA
jgi:uncharacterized membrane protein